MVLKALLFGSWCLTLLIMYCITKHGDKVNVKKTTMAIHWA